MSFLDDLSQKLSMVGHEAASQTKAFAETTRINVRISEEERQINAYFIQLGRNYFEANKNNPNAENYDLINNIKDAMQRIDLYKEDIRKARGIRTCPQCGSEIPVSVIFCNYCGAKVPTEAFVQNETGFPSGTEGLGSTFNQNGIYSTPNTDSEATDSEAINLDTTAAPSVEKTTVSLEKTDEQ